MLTPIFLHELRYPRTPGNISSRKRKRERNLGSCNPFRTTVKLSIDHRHLTWPIMSSINCNSLLPCFPSAPVYIGGRDRRLPQQWTPLPFPPPPLIARIWRHAALPRYFSWFRWWIVKKKKNASDGPRAINFRWPERRRYALPPLLPVYRRVLSADWRVGLLFFFPLSLFFSLLPPFRPLFSKFEVNLDRTPDTGLYRRLCLHTNEASASRATIDLSTTPANLSLFAMNR